MNIILTLALKYISSAIDTQAALFHPLNAGIKTFKSFDWTAEHNRLSSPVNVEMCMHEMRSATQSR